MAKIYNSDVTKALAKNAGIQLSVDKVPNELAEKIVPTMETNPDLLRKTTHVISAEAINSTTTTIYTTPTNQDFYVTGILLSLTKDATSTSLRTNVTGVIGGATVRLASISTITLNAEIRTIYVPFTFPVKLDRNTIMTITNTTNVANISAGCVVYGYIDEKSLA